VDGLVATVGANKTAALETLETIKYCKEQGFATICGLSNISFGMPERSYVNTAFLTLAIHEGLTMAIANPSQELLVSCAFAADMLLAKDGADIKYIEYAEALKEKQQQAPIQPKETAQPSETLNTKKTNSETSGSNTTLTHASELVNRLNQAVLKGNRNGIAALTKEALDAGEKPQELLNGALLPAINLVGEYFDKGKYFLPQLIASAEAMKNSIAVLEPLLMENTSDADMPVVVIATVEGDIHDIGKNLVALMLKNYGFKVIDLGKDVPKEKIIEAAKENNAQIIALSALMTTTMQRMREVIAYKNEQKLASKVMIGGAVITQEYADEIGADGYSRDAAEAVKLAQRLVMDR
jgi:5-methyltetrahydrofolate--homocysteine methyltransferase